VPSRLKCEINKSLPFAKLILDDIVVFAPPLKLVSYACIVVGKSIELVVPKTKSSSYELTTRLAGTSPLVPPRYVE